jgi:hypothetical protein
MFKADYLKMLDIATRDLGFQQCILLVANAMVKKGAPVAKTVERG